VNRIYYEATKLVVDKNLPITSSVIQTAANNLILSRETHLTNFTTILKDPRVRAVIEPIITGGIINNNAHAEYVEDLGLIKRDAHGQYIISNSLYAEVIPRELCNLEWLTTVLSSINRPFYFNKNGTINMDLFIGAWINFFNENADMWKERNKNDYHEAWPHLLFFAFVQRIVNGGGKVYREYALGTDSCDVMMEIPYENGKIQSEIVELKRRRKYKDMKLVNLMEKQWLPQLAKYLHVKGLEKGYMFVFDLSMEENQMKQEHHVEFRGKQFTVFVYYFK